MLNPKNGPMKTPEDLLEIRSRLEAQWAHMGVHVGTGFGIEGIYDRRPPRWMLYVYAEEPEKIRSQIPPEIDGYPIQVSGVPIAY
jgi:hypothetical protein